MTYQLFFVWLNFISYKWKINILSVTIHHIIPIYILEFLFWLAFLLYKITSVAIGMRQKQKVLTQIEKYCECQYHCQDDAVFIYPKLLLYFDTSFHQTFNFWSLNFVLSITLVFERLQADKFWLLWRPI